VSIGPVELLVLKFPGDRFRGAVADSFQELVDSGLIRVIDAVFAKKSIDDGVRVFELDELEAEDTATFEPAIAEITGLLNRDDVETLTARLEPGASAAVMLFEDAWATKFRDAVAAADGEVVLAERIPRDVIDELLAAREEELVTQ
jgi:hypothetical protein